MFLKDPSTVVGPYDTVLIPRGSTKTDWEVELGVVIGAEARYLADVRCAAACIGGYVVSHDVSERAFQLERGGQWDKGKSCETFNPVGPDLVTPGRARRRPAAGAGSRGQRATPPAEQHRATWSSASHYLVWYLSQFMVLHPGRPHQHRHAGGGRAGHRRAALPAPRGRRRALDRRPGHAPDSGSSRAMTDPHRRVRRAGGPRHRRRSRDRCGDLGGAAGPRCGGGGPRRPDRLALEDQVSCDVTDRSQVVEAVDAVLDATWTPRHRRQQRRGLRGGHGRGERRRGVAPGPRRQRGRDGPSVGRRAPGAAALSGRLHRQRLLHRRP